MWQQPTLFSDSRKVDSTPTPRYQFTFTETAMGKALILLKWARTSVSGYKLEDQSELSDKEIRMIFEWSKRHVERLEKPITLPKVA